VSDIQRVTKIDKVGDSARLLKATHANDLIKAMNRMLTAKVLVQRGRESQEPRSAWMISEENAVMNLTVSDIVGALGNAAGSNLSIPNPCSSPTRPVALGDLHFDTCTGIWYAFRPNGWEPVVPSVATVGADGSTQWTGGLWHERRGDVWVLIGSGCPIVTTLEYRSKTTTATLCGFSEFIDPSLPPKKYRKKTFAGQSSRCNYNSAAACNAGTPINGSDRFVINGLTSEYNATTCAVVDSGSTTTYQNIGSCPATSVISTGGVFDPTCGSTPQFTWSCTSSIQKTLTPTGQCATENGLIYSQIVANITIILSVEDTEADAIIRANAAAGWDLTPKTVSTMQSRGAGSFSFSSVYVEVRANLTGLSIGKDYTFRIYYGGRLYGSTGAFSFVATEEVTFTATSTIEDTPWIALPQFYSQELTVLSSELCQIT
jgi:hypothetical protein